MRMKKILLVTLVAVLCTVSPVRAEGTKGSGKTTVGYTSSTVAQIPGGNGNDSIKTGDYANIGKMLVLFGGSAFFIIFLALHRERRKGGKEGEVL